MRHPGFTSRAARVAGACALVGAVTLALSVVILGSLTPGYDPGADTISHLASPGQPYAILASAAMVAYGLLVVVTAPSLSRHVPERQRLLAGCIGAYGVAGVAAGALAKPAPGAATTTAGFLHVIATMVGGAAIVAAMVTVAWCLPRSRWGRESAATAATVVFGAAAFRWAWDSGVYGWIERVVVALAVVWIVALSQRRDPTTTPSLSSPEQSSTQPAEVPVDVHRRMTSVGGSAFRAMWSSTTTVATRWSAGARPLRLGHRPERGRRS